MAASSSSEQVVIDTSPDARIAVLEAANELRRLRRKQAEYFRKVAAKVEEYRDILPKNRKELASWLQSEIGFSKSEASAYVTFHARFDEATASLLEKAAAPDAIREVLKSGSTTRAECFARMKDGIVVTPEDVVQMRRSAKTASMSADKTAEKLRREFFERAARELARSTRLSLEGDACEILDLFDAAEVTKALSPEHSPVSQAVEADAPVSIRLLERIEGLFPALRNDAAGTKEISAKGLAGISLVRSWKTVLEVRRVGLATDELIDRLDDPVGPRACLEFLAGRRAAAVHSLEKFHLHTWEREWPSHAVVTSDGDDTQTQWARARVIEAAAEHGEVPRFHNRILRPALRKLTFVDLDAGIGSTSLGLHAAGFEPAMVFTREKTSNESIRINRPEWMVRDWNSVPREELLADLGRMDVDLVTSGIPWHQHVVPSSAYKQAASAVRRIRPKAFLFECRKKDVDDLALIRPLEDHGYDVRWHSVQPSRYGIAQSKERYVLVGSRDGLLQRFSVPILDTTIHRSFKDVVAPVLDQYAATLTDATARARLEDKISEWRDSHGESLSPDIAAKGWPFGKRKWLEDFGVDISLHAHTSITAERMDSGIPLTKRMLEELQTIPDLWATEGLFGWRRETLLGALPTIAAKMLGLAIYSALTGVTFNYDRAARTPLLKFKSSFGATRDGIEYREYRTRPVTDFLTGAHEVFRKEFSANRPRPKAPR